MLEDKPLTTETVWQVYEREKQIIRESAKSPDEYDAEIRRLISELGV